MKALTAFNRKNRGVNGVLLSVLRRQQPLTGKIAALKECNRKNSGVNGVQSEK